MVRRKRHYESTRVKLDMSFEEALARLCQAGWSGKAHDAKVGKSPRASADSGQNKKPNS